MAGLWQRVRRLPRKMEAQRAAAAEKKAAAKRATEAQILEDGRPPHRSVE